MEFTDILEGQKSQNKLTDIFSRLCCFLNIYKLLTNGREGHSG